MGNKIIMVLFSFVFVSSVYAQATYDYKGNIVRLHASKSIKTKDGKFQTYNIHLPAPVLVTLMEHGKVKEGVVEKALPAITLEKIRAAYPRLNNSQLSEKIYCDALCYETQTNRVIGYNKRN